MEIPVRFGNDGYTVTVERGALRRVGTLCRLDRKVLIVTDDGVPARYAEAVFAACREPYLAVVPQGEGSKSFAVLERLLTDMLERGFSRKDCVVSVGGGVVSDLAGFAAATYMRGIDFYAVPTTVLSEVDASVGGKTAINLGGVKNIVGAFYRPKAVVIDPETLATLPPRQIASGLGEAVKMAVTFDAAFFTEFENGDPLSKIDAIIARAVTLKRDVVERDEKEQDLRRVLNFGHTIGHGIESAAGGALHHGECVAIGMLPMCSDKVRARLLPVLKRLGLPTAADLDPEAVYAAMLHDKKSTENGVAAVFSDEIGSYRIETVRPEALRARIETVIRRNPA